MSELLNSPEFALICLVLAVLALVFHKQIANLMVDRKSRRKATINNWHVDLNGKRLRVKEIQPVYEVLSDRQNSASTEKGNIYFHENVPPLRGVSISDVGLSTFADMTTNTPVIKLHTRDELDRLTAQVMEQRAEIEQLYQERSKLKKFFAQLMKEEFKSVNEARKQISSGFSSMFGGGLGVGGFGGGEEGEDSE